jgi:hypothetical protein
MGCIRRHGIGDLTAGIGNAVQPLTKQPRSGLRRSFECANYLLGDDGSSPGEGCTSERRSQCGEVDVCVVVEGELGVEKCPGYQCRERLRILGATIFSAHRPPSPDEYGTGVRAHDDGRRFNRAMSVTGCVGTPRVKGIQAGCNCP